MSTTSTAISGGYPLDRPPTAEPTVDVSAHVWIWPARPARLTHSFASTPRWQLAEELHIRHAVLEARSDARDWLASNHPPRRASAERCSGPSTS
jgi:hypothetical protein